MSYKKEFMICKNTSSLLDNKVYFPDPNGKIYPLKYCSGNDWCYLKNSAIPNNSFRIDALHPDRDVEDRSPYIVKNGDKEFPYKGYKINGAISNTD